MNLTGNTCLSIESVNTHTVKKEFYHEQQQKCAHDKIVAWAVLSNLILTYPAVLCLFLPVPPLTLLTAAYSCLYMGLLILRGKIGYYNRLLWQCAVLQVAAWIMLAVLSRDGVYITRIVYVINAFIAMACLWNYGGALRKFQEAYVKLIAVLGVGGVIAFVLVLLGVLTPLITYENLDGREGVFYGLTCTNARLGNVIRYSGIFDEPGAMAFWGMMALLINEFSIQNRRLERVILFCLVFTFSMAYYIQVFFYFLFFKLRSMKQVVGICAFMGLAVAGIFASKDTEFDLYTLTLMRFEMDDSGSLKGDNRSDAAAVAKEKFLSSPFIGHGPSVTTVGEYLADNQYENLATDGIIGTFVMYLPLLVLVVPFNKKVLCALFILALGYLQRPFHQNFTHAFILYLMSFTLIEYKKDFVRLKWEQATQRLQ